MDSRLADDAGLAADLVREAGQLASKMRLEGVEVHQKTSASDLVTAADRAAEELVVKRLAAERPGDGILGEEGASDVGTTGRTWVIDPVDGTYNFVHGLDWWCSALALRRDRVVLGAVHHPHDDLVWIGGQGLPTTRNGEPVPVIQDRDLADCSMTTYLSPQYFDVPDVLEPFSAVVTRTKAIRMNGSGSMDMAAVADGRIDLWCQHSVPPWDWMPGQGIVEGAGGVATQVVARGVTWSLAGAPSAVAEAVERLTSA